MEPGRLAVVGLGVEGLSSWPLVCGSSCDVDQPEAGADNGAGPLAEIVEDRRLVCGGREVQVGGDLDVDRGVSVAAGGVVRAVDDASKDVRGEAGLSSATPKYIPVRLRSVLCGARPDG